MIWPRTWRHDTMQQSVSVASGSVMFITRQDKTYTTYMLHILYFPDLCTLIWLLWLIGCIYLPQLAMRNAADAKQSVSLLDFSVAHPKAVRSSLLRPHLCFNILNKIVGSVLIHVPPRDMYRHNLKLMRRDCVCTCSGHYLHLSPPPALLTPHEFRVWEQLFCN